MLSFTNHHLLPTYQELCLTADHEDGNLTIDRSANYPIRVLKYEKMLAEVDGITKLLQTRLLPLSDCRNALQQLISAVATDKTNPAKSLYQCKLGTKYIGMDSHLVTDPLFMTGVMKLQERRVH
jgi:hypothetical protein